VRFDACDGDDGDRFHRSFDLHLGEFLPPLLACLSYVICYWMRSRTLANAGRPVASWRRASFLTGVCLVTIVQLPPLDQLGDTVLIAHMLQHIVIGDIASLLIVLGVTGSILAPLLRTRASRGIEREWQRFDLPAWVAALRIRAKSPRATPLPGPCVGACRDATRRTASASGPAA
jgi:cytochrome c oxidase assembly factor CtaG